MTEQQDARATGRSPRLDFLIRLTHNQVGMKDTSGSNQETIIKQHRHWTRWIVGRRAVGEGNLVLTNRRLLFLHRIESSPEVTASIKKLADAPMESVLNHALTLHKNCLQIQLQHIKRVGIGVFVRLPFPYFFLNVSYNKGKTQAPQIATFQFRRLKKEILLHSQIITDLAWMVAIRQAIRKANRSG